MERRASTWGARFVVVLAAVGALALVGCGGHVAGIGDDDSGPGTDSGVDSGPGYDSGPTPDSSYDVPCTTESLSSGCCSPACMSRSTVCSSPTIATNRAPSAFA